MDVLNCYALVRSDENSAECLIKFEIFDKVHETTRKDISSHTIHRNTIGKVSVVSFMHDNAKLYSRWRI